MLDIPIPSNQSIIVFSAIGNQSEGAGRLRQGISFAAKTAVTVTGGVETDYVRIEPSGNGFSIICKGNRSAGTTTFSVTATTAGDEERGLESATASFTFRVIVLGEDYPHLLNSFHEFRVGESVEAGLSLFFVAQQCSLNISMGITPIDSLTDGEIRYEPDPATNNEVDKPVWYGKSSGLYLSPIIDEGRKAVIGATIKGTATRPGVYSLSFDMSSYSNTGQNPHAFYGSTGPGLLIINVYDDRESPKLLTESTHVHNPDFVRVIRHGLEDNYTAARLTGPFSRSGNLWTRRVSEAINASVSDVWEYRMERNVNTGNWTLSGRNYLSDETAPDFSSLATAAGRFGEIPPNIGWSGLVLCAGDGGKFVAGFGFFDQKGTREFAIEGETESFSGPVYEQQPMVAAQYPGWNNPPATQYADGLYLAPDPTEKWRISANPLALNGNEVTIQEITHIASPYSPATAVQEIAGVNYRDLVLLAGNVPVNANLTGPLTLQMGGCAAGVPAHYTWLRQFPPPDSWSRKNSIPVNVSSKTISKNLEKVGSRSRTRNSVGYAYVAESWDADVQTSETETTFDAELSADAFFRANPAMISGAIGISSGGGLDYKQISTRIHEYFYNMDEAFPEDGIHHTYGYDNETKTITPTGSASGGGTAFVVVGSGRDAAQSNVTSVIIMCAEAGAAYPDSRIVTEKKYGIAPDVTETTTESSGGGIGASGGGMIPVYQATSFLWGVKKFDVSSVNASFTGTKTSYSRAVNNIGGGSIFDDTEKTYTMESKHFRTVYSGDGIPAAMKSYGATYTKETIVTQWSTDNTATGESDGGTTTETNEKWVSDADGEVYQALYKDYGDVPEEDALPDDTAVSYHIGRVSSTRNESYHQNEYSFF